ncbi:DUF2892 domain-containing protein [Winogradskyella sp. A3E31]|uniref:YgaP family membrane protein n=1 Tax=Winogradskyella sp. A3E31 TaxID=3349637 RepID=UPI00398AE793
MTKNIGSTDKFIRLLLAGIIVILSYLEIIEGTLAIILLAIAGILVVTSFFNLCPLYLALGKSTCKVKDN